MAEALTSDAAQPADAARLIAETTAAQLRASDPAASAWVGANAGAGKTHVLKMRVLRLLIGGVAPERILCLTYTKAAAAEMAARVFGELARWSTADDGWLEGELEKLFGRVATAEEKRAARQLFARAIETPGGLKVQTIHAFCERLLQRFPLEAQVPPGFEILDEGMVKAMMRAAVDRALGEANARPDGALGHAVRHAIAFAAGDQFDDVLAAALKRRAWLLALTRHETAGGNAEGQTRVRALYEAAFDLAGEETEASIEQAMADVLGAEDCRMIAGVLAGGDKKTDLELGEKLGAAGRAATAGERRAFLAQAFMTIAGTVRSDKFITKGMQAAEPAITGRLFEARNQFAGLSDKLRCRRVVEATLALAAIADRVMQHYSQAKARRAALDFDDLIAQAASLLDRSGAAAWVLYKLDGGLEHVLVDEAQDTSPVQWRVVQQLVAEFFAGEGAREDMAREEEAARPRTIFAVGDEKQSIYSFQGAAPEMFAAAGGQFRDHATAAGQTFHPVPLELSFRTVAPVLEAVDRVFSDAARTPGLTSTAEAVRHLVLRQGHAGLFELWEREVPEEEMAAPAFEPLEEARAASPVSRLAERIAGTIADWLANGERLTSQDRAIRASDILVLVRNRQPFAGEMVRALKQRGIAVAGADRIVLGEHIAVQDLMALADFLLLPEDDLALANVLKSPLFGLDDDDLIAIAPERPGLLWTALLKAAEGNARLQPAGEQLKRWRAQADFSPPFEFFANVLDRDGGRARLIGRLGADAGDALDEFMNLALTYDEQAPPSLQGFTAWLREGVRQIKRDMEHGRDEVRVMTVHGSKGLEAPIVFLPDTCSGAVSARREPLAALAGDGIAPGLEEVCAWTVKGTSKTAVIEAARTRETALAQEEHNRLLYVAMTRARDRLYVGGFENRRGMAAGSWYDMIETGLEGLLAEAQDAEGRRIRRLASSQTAPAQGDTRDVAAAILPEPAPDWALRPAPREANRTVPLAPSRIETGQTDAEGEWPGLSELRDAVRPPLEPASASPVALAREQSLARGTLMHALLEHLPEVDREDRDAAARRFLAARGRSLPDAVLDEIRAKALAVIGDDRFADAFGAQSRAEVPIAAIVPPPDGNGPALKVNGQIDRLVRTKSGVLIIDYKSNRRAPATADAVPIAYLLQLAAYRMVLAQIHAPAGIARDNIEAAILWTDVAVLMPVPGGLLDRIQTRLWEVSS